MRATLPIVTVILTSLATAPTAAALERVLEQVTFPQRKEIDIEFSVDPKAPKAEIKAEVEHREGQSAIDLKFRDMKPAILFGGEVTCYVLWAIERGGTAENLGEVWVRDTSETVEYSTGLKAFALIITGESHPLVSRPSELVLFTSMSPPAKKAPSEGFNFAGFGPAPEIEYPSIAPVMWDDDTNLDVQQAERVYQLAVAAGAEEYAASQLRRAAITLAQARNLSRSNRTNDEAIDYSRRTVALASEAIETTRRMREAARLEAEIAARQAEMEALEARAAEAEAAATAAQRATAEAQSALDAATRERTAAQAAVAAATAELARIEREKGALQQSVAKLGEEKADLSDRLQGALAQVADTRETARGTIVNLPDILFDLNESTLKNEARVVLSKLAGILLIMQELNLRVEGHTDSTGDADYNQRLSEKRAASVRDFLAQQGVGMGRMVAVGYGLTRPVATNETREGRAQNRRVEIVIAEGTVAAAD